MPANVWLSFDFNKGYFASKFRVKRVLTAHRMKFFPNTIDRNRSYYKDKHYRAHWQPLWALIGLVSCTVFMLSFGLNAIYDLCARSKGVSKEDSIVDLVAAYVGVNEQFPLQSSSSFADFMTSR